MQNKTASKEAVLKRLTLGKIVFLQHLNAVIARLRRSKLGWSAAYSHCEATPKQTRIERSVTRTTNQNLH